MVAGCIGFVLAGFSPVDALLTTVSTIATVGYLPPHAPLSVAAKIFMAVLILAGVGTGIYVLGSLTEFLVEGGLHGTWKRRSMSKRIDRLENHFIICGFGRVGQQVARQLRETGEHAFVIVDTNPDTIAVARDWDVIYVEGDATNNATLEAVGVRRARALLACADSDVNNVYVTLSARHLSANLYILARAADPDAEQKLLDAGANRVISPYTMAGNRMAHLAIQPQAADYIDVAMPGKKLGVQIEERVVAATSPLINRTVRDIRDNELGGAHVLALEHDGKLITSVDDSHVVAAEDRILVAGTGDQLSGFDSKIA
ncbi:MAG TPA: potassium channel protein [Candidatus Sulfotelmatobacter sp.]|nr:potassium channel protein [Candidatus Sulfotelmatobacter sp.]